MACLLPLIGANAQGKKCEKDYLPKQGDWAIGIDVVPVLKYIGNAFNGNTNNTIEHLGGTPFTKGNNYFESDLMPDVSISGKYLLTDEFALRANLGLMIRSEYARKYSVDDKAMVNNPLGDEKVIDQAHNIRNGMSLSLGGEYRKGTKRVQGVFGAGVLFAYQKNKTNYTWGNEMTTVNQQPSIDNDLGSYNNGYRTLEKFGNASTFYTGITGSAGVEWFVAPKISLGAEVNLTAYYVWESKQYTKSEGYNAALNKIEQRTDLTSPGIRAFVLGTESLGGSLNMTFYF